MTQEIQIPSVLSFERKLDPSDALFYAGQWRHRERSDHQWQPVSIREKAVRGTISHRLKTKSQDQAKLDAEIDNPNLQRVDVAAMPTDCDTLKVNFALRVLGNIGQPTTCNNMAYQNALRQIMETYQAEHGFAVLALRYASNIANGRFLWRNRIGAEAIEVKVHQRDSGELVQSWQFDALNLSMRDFDHNSAEASKIQSLADEVQKALEGNQFALFDIEALIQTAEGLEVFPSQELIMDQSTTKKGKKSKTLYHVDNVAAMHSQKIGNALRTIDTWYENPPSVGPIAVEPYGSVTNQGKAYRQPKDKIDFYNLFDNWVVKGKQPDEGNQHFVIANLIRGGVFGKSEEA